MDTTYDFGLPSDLLIMPSSDTSTWSTSPSSSSTSGLIDNLSSSIGKVADFGFNVQRSVLANQAQSQDIQLQALKASLGFKTAQTQATTQATIAQYQAQGQIAQAMKAAGISTGNTSPIMLILGAGLIYFLAKKG